MAVYYDGQQDLAGMNQQVELLKEKWDKRCAEIEEEREGLYLCCDGKELEVESRLNFSVPGNPYKEWTVFCINCNRRIGHFPSRLEAFRAWNVGLK
ncbi:MAG: hypothetical protein HQL56_05740 [Magnetococcales bacterium]|nr:hypothetical protein [Magnetococcales bacterium]